MHPINKAMQMIVNRMHSAIAFGNKNMFSSIYQAKHCKPLPNFMVQYHTIRRQATIVDYQSATIIVYGRYTSKLSTPIRNSGAKVQVRAITTITN